MAHFSCSWLYLDHCRMKVVWARADRDCRSNLHCWPDCLACCSTRSLHWFAIELYSPALGQLSFDCPPSCQIDHFVSHHFSPTSLRFQVDWCNPVIGTFTFTLSRSRTRHALSFLPGRRISLRSTNSRGSLPCLRRAEIVTAPASLYFSFLSSI